MDEHDRETELCQAARTGDKNAASKLLKAHHQRIYAYLRRLCGNQQDAEDLTQKVFCEVWRSLPRFEGRSALSTWIHGIAYYVFADWARKSNGRGDFRGEAWWETLAEDGPSPFETTVDRELTSLLYSIVDALDPDQRQLIHLHYYQGLSLRETAEVLGIATSTLKYRLRSALESIRAKAKQAKLEQTYGGKNDE